QARRSRRPQAVLPLVRGERRRNARAEGRRRRRAAGRLRRRRVPVRPRFYVVRGRGLPPSPLRRAQSVAGVRARGLRWLEPPRRGRARRGGRDCRGGARRGERLSARGAEGARRWCRQRGPDGRRLRREERRAFLRSTSEPSGRSTRRDRKSTRLNSSHVKISYAVFCLKKKKRNEPPRPP